MRKAKTFIFVAPSSFTTATHKSLVSGHPGDWLLYSGSSYLWVLGMGLAAWRIYGTYNFEVAPRILVEFWTLSSPFILGRFKQKIVCLIADITHAHAHQRAHALAQARAHAHTHMRTHIHTCTHAHPHTHTQTHTHTGSHSSI